MRTIVSGNLVGEQNHPSRGPQLNLNFTPSWQALGSPLVDEFGKVVGMLGGRLLPSSSGDLWELKSATFSRESRLRSRCRSK